MTITNDDIRVLKTGTCQSLSGKTKLTFDIGCDNGSAIYARLTKSSGTGSFSKAWVDLQRVHQLLEKTKGESITQSTLSPLFKGQSANGPGFLLAVLKHQGLVGPMADNPRCYRRLDAKTFFAEVRALMNGTTSAAKAAPKTNTVKRQPAVKTAKPVVSAETSPTRSAVYVSEVHGPLIPAPKPARKAPLKR